LFCDVCSGMLRTCVRALTVGHLIDRHRPAAVAVEAMAEADTAFYENLIRQLMPDIFAKVR